MKFENEVSFFEILHEYSLILVPIYMIQEFAIKMNYIIE